MNVSTVGDYLLQRALGQGGMGRVWHGVHQPTGRRVAVKFLSDDHHGDERYHSAFKAEVHALAALHHKSIVPILDYGTTTEAIPSLGIGAEHPFLVMEFVQQGDLNDAGVLQWAHIRRITDSLLDALAHAHAHGIIHRDVKPSNILLDSDEAGTYAKLADFGIVWDQTQARTSLSLAAGSTGYMAPEQGLASAGDFGPWTDLYAVGCVVWRLVCGRTPFDGPPELSLRRKLENRLPTFEPIVSVPRNLDRWLSAMLSADPRDRYPHARDAAHGLALIADSQPLVRPTRGRGSSTTAAEPTREMTTAVSAPLTSLITTSFERVQRPVAPFPDDWRLPADTDRRGIRLSASLIHLQSTRFVGREAERDHLWKVLRDTEADRAARAVRVVAPRGRGASALVRWLGHRAEELGAAQFIYVRQSGQETSIDAWRETLTWWLGHPEGDLGTRLRRAADRHRWSEELVRALSRLLRGETQGFGEAHETLFLWLVEQAKRRPIVVVVDEARETGSEQHFLKHFLRRAQERPAPVLFVETLTTETGSINTVSSDIQTIELAPLTPRESHEFLQSLIPLESTSLVHAVESSAGEPSRMIALVRGWMRSGALGWKGSSFSWTGAAPTDVETGLSEDAWIRMLALDAPAHCAAALDIAMALGDTVHIDDWRYVLDHEGATTNAAIEVLIEAELARFEPQLDRLSFERPEAREQWAAALRGHSRWTTAHRRCAERLGDLPDIAPERIARHWVNAGAPQRAIDHLAQHIAELTGRFHVLRAAPIVVAWEQAAAALGWPDDDPRRLPIWELRVNLAFYVNPGTIGQRANIEQWGQRMRSVAESAGLPHWQSVAYLLLAWHQRLGSRRREAIALAEQALALALAGDTIELQCRARWERAQNLIYLDPSHALLDCAWILQHAAATSYLRPGTLVSAAAAHHALKELDAAVASAHAALECAYLGPSRIQGLAWTELAKVELERGNLGEAHRGFAAATADRARQGLRGGYTECYLASTLVLLQRNEEALPVLTRLIDTESPSNAAELRVWRALARHGVSDEDGALRDMVQAHHWYQENRVRPDTAIDAARRLAARVSATSELHELCHRLQTITPAS